MESKSLKEIVLQSIDDLIVSTYGEEFGIEHMVGTCMPDRLEADDRALMLDLWDLREKLSGHPPAMVSDEFTREGE